jgi:hypothetical protein
MNTTADIAQEYYILQEYYTDLIIVARMGCKFLCGEDPIECSKYLAYFAQGTT